MSEIPSVNQVERLIKMETKIKELLPKLRSGTLTEKEADLLWEALNSVEISFFDEDFKNQWNQEPLKSSDLTKKKVWERIHLKISKENEIIRRRKKRNQRQDLVGTAAIFFGVILIFVFAYKFTFQPEIIPANAVVVEFDDGDIELLGNSRNTLSEKKGIEYREDKLVYTQNAEAEEIEYHTLHIPRGRKFQLEMADGTNVYLNSGSTVKYPVNFISGNSREVYLKGEAYFQVQKNGDPFTVNTTSLKTVVLGTAFNIQDHSANTPTEVVLVEGSVMVKGAKDQLLAPQQKLSYNKKTEEFKIEEVNTSDYVAWTKGYLLFRNEDFSSIIPKLERHFDVEITNNFKELAGKKFTGRFRSEGLPEVLEVFRTASDFKFQIYGKEVIIEEPIY